MLDLGFTEILLIGVIAVLVLGPEKLPETMATIFKYLRKIGNFISETKENIDRELQIKELREEANQYKNDLMSASQKLQEITNQEIRNPLESEMAEIKKIGTDTKQDITLRKESAKSELQAILEKNKSEESKIEVNKKDV